MGGRSEDQSARLCIPSKIVIHKIPNEKKSGKLPKRKASQKFFLFDRPKAIDPQSPCEIMSIYFSPNSASMFLTHSVSVFQNYFCGGILIFEPLARSNISQSLDLQSHSHNLWQMQPVSH